MLLYQYMVGFASESDIRVLCLIFILLCLLFSLSLRVMSSPFICKYQLLLILVIKLKGFIVNEALLTSGYCVGTVII